MSKWLIKYLTKERASCLGFYKIKIFLDKQHHSSSGKLDWIEEELGSVMSAKNDPPYMSYVGTQ